MTNATGLGPLDVMTIVQKLMMGQQRGLRKLETSQQIEQTQISSYGQLQSLIGTFQTQLNNISSAFSTIGYQASSSNSNILTANITANVVAPGIHTLTITQLAMAQSDTSGNSFSAEDTALGISETLQFENENGSFSLSISDTDTLDNIRDNINNSLVNIGITASVVRGTASDNVTPLYFLNLSAQETGTANGFTISGDSENIFNMTQKSQALDAMLTFDGINMVRSSNTVTDAIDGLSFNLLETTAADTSVTISITENNQNQVQTVKTAIQSMLDAYNQVINYIDQNTEIIYTDQNPFTHEEQTHRVKNESFPLIKMIMQTAMGQTISDLGSITSLNDAGIVTSDLQTATIPNTNISYNTYGELEFYTDPEGNQMVDQVLANNFSALEEFFTNINDGFINNLNDTINDDVLGTGAIFDVTQTLGQELHTVDYQIVNEKSRLDKVQDAFLIKYAALNSLLAELQATSDYIEKQFATLENYIHKK